MHLTFFSLELTNFKAYRERTVLSLDKQGVHLLCGKNLAAPRLESNGAAKSTLFDALSWCLYGVTAGGLRTPDIRPWSAPNTTTKVVVRLFCDKAPHTIVRTANPNRLTLDDADTGQEQIDRLIGLKADTFHLTVILGQDQPLFLDLKPRDKMGLFTEVLPIEHWEAQYSKAAADRVAALNAEHLMLEGQLAGYTTAAEQITPLIAEARRKISRWGEEHEAALTDAAHSLTTLEKQLHKANRKRDGADLRYDGAQTELRALKAQHNKSEAEHRATLVEWQEHKTKQEIDARTLRELERQLAKLGTGSRCITCGQSLAGTALAKHRNEVRDNIARLREAVDKGIPKRLTKAVVARERWLEKSTQDQLAFQQKSDTAESELKFCTSAVHELEVKVKVGQEQLNRLRTDHNPYKEQLRGYHRQLDALERDADEAKERLVALNKELVIEGFWVKGFKEIPLYIIEEVLAEIEFTTNNLLPSVGLEGWEVKFAVEKETQSGTIQRGLNVTILSPDNAKAVNWKVWSGGEGRRLRIVASVALAEVLLSHAGVRPNLLVLDEPSRSLSRGGILEVIDFLADRADDTEQCIFYVDHQAIESSSFKSVLTVVKTKAGAALQ